jgi:competence protein ComEC
MKLPVLWIAATFAAGIGLASRWQAPLALWIAASTLAILVGTILARKQYAAAAWMFALVAWMGVGGVAVSVERSVAPANHVTRLIAAGQIDTSEALRWRGRLREDPMVQPWGRRYEISLEEVEVAGAALPTYGGLRVNLYGEENRAEAPENLRAGDRVEALVRARPPRNFLDPGAFDVRGYLARQKIDLVGSLRSGELLRLIDHPRPTFFERLARARGELFARVDSLFAVQPERAAVLRAMLLGDRSFVDSNVVTAFQKTGAYHVLVVAGLHVGAITVFFFWLGRRLRFSAAATSLFALCALVAYVGIVQDRPPVLRAALVAAFYLCARPLFRRIELLNTVALAALAILIWKPSSLADSSFQLSFLAAGVIAGLAVPWIERSSEPYRAGLRHLGDVTRDMAHSPKVVQFRIEMRAAAQWIASRAQWVVAAPVRIGLRLWEVLLLSFVIQWGMSPVLAQDFHRVSLAGPLSNIPAVFLTGVIVPLGFLTLTATFLWTRLALVLARGLGFCAGLLLETVNWFSRWSRVSYRIPGPSAWLMVAFFAAFICLAAAARAATARGVTRSARRQMPPAIRPAEWASAIALAACTILVATHPFPAELERGRLEVSVLDVGQGDSIFAAFPDGRTMLIDGGGLPGSSWTGGIRSGMDVGEEVVSPYLWSRGLKRLDVVALTHAHHDHLDGLRSVLENFRVGQLWIGRDEETLAFKALLEEARTKGVPIVHKVPGDKFDFDGVKGDVLWPADVSATPEASNDDSLVLRLEDGEVRFLLPGDIQQHVEEKLVAKHAPLAADFLKVPHHGSKTSSTEAFLEAVAPRVAVISVGESNPFGHPTASVIERYENSGVRLLRTDRDGAVTALTDGHELAVHTFAKAHRQ